MKPFRFQKFEVQQSKNVFRVGTDAVLLGVLANVDGAKRVLEIGVGTGIISLMLAQRNSQAHFVGLDIDENAARLANQNFSESIFSQRMHVLCEDFNRFSAEEKFDFIVSNPPYFEASDSEKDKKARQMILLNFEQLLYGAEQHLTDEGIVSLIVPYHVTKSLLTIGLNCGLYLNRKVNIYGIIEAEVPKRVVLEFSRIKKEVKEENFVIESAPRVYSQDYLEATKDFHIFKYN